MYFWIKNEKCFDKYNQTWDKVSNIIKKNLTELIYNKKYLKGEKKLTQKKVFIVFLNK